VTFRSPALPRFWDLYDRLPAEIQAQADKQYALFTQNPWHPSLRYKQVGPFWLVRISYVYRALGVRDGQLCSKGFERNRTTSQQYRSRKPHQLRRLSQFNFSDTYSMHIGRFQIIRSNARASAARIPALAHTDRVPLSPLQDRLVGTRDHQWGLPGKLTPGSLSKTQSRWIRIDPVNGVTN
jgi:hypothetical protein